MGNPSTNTTGRPFQLFASNCILNLDADNYILHPTAKQFFDEVTAKFPENGKILMVQNAIVTYSGGTVIPLNKIIFVNCIFDFKPSFVIPPAGGQSVTRQLLAANLENATVTLPGM